MSKLQCKCGHLISDVAYPCPTEARCLSQSVFEALDRRFASDVFAFLAAVRSGCRDAWLVKTFGDIYPKDLPDAEVISDLLSARYFKNSLRISECKQCGRLWIQKEPDDMYYRSFSPDDRDGYCQHFAYTNPDKQPEH